MIIDARNLQEETNIDSDICIIGAGAAGITLAREFIDQPYQVCILESGGLDFDDQTQSLYKGDDVGVPYFPLKESRARYLGGSTNLWAGWCRPLDDIDFEDRPWMPYSGWPIATADLLPYYKRAQKACQLGPYEYHFPYWQEALEALRCQRPQFEEHIETLIWQIIPPTHIRFGEAYRAELEQAKNINTYLYANVVEIETNDTARATTRVRVACLEGKNFSVSAKIFILAVGGIGNPRLLLASNQFQSNGLGNDNDLVGRFFMEHPYLESGKITFSTTPALYSQRHIQIGETFLATGLGLSKTVQAREQILNFGARLIPIVPDWVEAFNRLKFSLKKTNEEDVLNHNHKAFPSITEGRKFRTEGTFLEDLQTVLLNLDSIAARACTKLTNKSFYTGQSNLCQTHLIGEQAPNPDSRVTLSSDRDALGMNLAKLDWRLSPIDKYTIERSQQLLAEEFARSGLGKLQVELGDESSWEVLRGSYHHMGTTRMSTNPRQGVVNEDCQVHGISNLYIAGSSVFPTSGLSNPTLTIVALAVRLADHIKEELSGGSIGTDFGRVDLAQVMQGSVVSSRTK